MTLPSVEITRLPVATTLHALFCVKFGSECIDTLKR